MTAAGPANLGGPGPTDNDMTGFPANAMSAVRASVKAHAVAEAGRPAARAPKRRRRNQFSGSAPRAIAGLWSRHGRGGNEGKRSQNQDEDLERMSRVAVIGAGYVGLVTSAMLARWATTSAAPTSCLRRWRCCRGERFP